MTVGGTASYAGCTDLPTLVSGAVELARSLNFTLSCRPEQGRLLQLLAQGQAGGVIGETGTGCGVGLAWMVSRAIEGTRLFSVEAVEDRAHAARNLFHQHDNVQVAHADWTALLEHGPFDLLVLDGGGAGKTDQPVEVQDALVIGGTVVIDDFTPMTGWPPLHDGKADSTRLHWLQHPALVATEVRLAPDLATIVGTRVR